MNNIEDTAKKVLHRILVLVVLLLLGLYAYDNKKANKKVSKEEGTTVSNSQEYLDFLKSDHTRHFGEGTNKSKTGAYRNVGIRQRSESLPVSPETRRGIETVKAGEDLHSGTLQKVHESIKQVERASTSRPVGISPSLREDKPGNGLTLNLGLFGFFKKGVGADFQVYRIGRFGGQFGVGYDFSDESVNPIVSIGYNIERLTRITHNLSLIGGYMPVKNKFTVGIRINL